MKKGIDYPGVTVVFMCHDGAGNFLLNKRSVNCRDEHGKWDAGGGGVDLGEGVIETLTKEITEEYGTEILDHEFLGYRDCHRVHNENKTHWIALDFLVHVDRSKVVNNEPHKFDEIGWFKWGEFPEPRHSLFPLFFDTHKEQLSRFEK
ncbi:NUDIX domain-containing protein [archaeon]|jgi:8-oxo-dGTP diphosphatase|nr:NUDIX domain-containing protein [archaeon]MBT6761627.1 NUDIX domain-containing protein [archaeon]